MSVARTASRRQNGRQHSASKRRDGQEAKEACSRSCRLDVISSAVTWLVHYLPVLYWG